MTEPIFPKPRPHPTDNCPRFAEAQENAIVRAEQHEASFSDKPVCCCTNGHKPWQGADGEWWVSTSCGCRIHYVGLVFATKDGTRP